MAASPFPGVDPFLEAQDLWGDFHGTFIGCFREALLDQLPDSYDARIEERICLMELGSDRARLRRPDVIVEHSDERAEATAQTAPALTALLEPITIPLSGVVERRERSIRVLHRPDRSLVAVIELLSPANKTDPDRGLYLEKRSELISTPVHLIELDLLLAGHRLPMDEPLPPSHYYAFVSRAERRPNSDVYAWTVRHRLSVIPVPIKAPDPDVLIDLGQVFATAYSRGRYERVIDYSKSLDLPLDAPSRQWAQEQAKTDR